MKMFGRKLTAIALFISLLFSFSFTVHSAGVNLEPVEGINLWPTNVEVDGIVDTEVKYSGNCSYKIVNHTPYGPMKYFIIAWGAKLEAGKTYVVGGEFKAEDAKSVEMSLTGGEKISITGPFGKTYDWKHAEVEVVPESSGKFEVYVQFLDSGTMWFDNLFIREKGSNVNLIKNGDFEVKEVAPPEEEIEDEPKQEIVGEAGEMVIGGWKTAEEYQKQLAELLSQPSFKLSDAKKFNNPGVVPIYRATEELTHDASGSGWDNYKPFVMTIPTTNYVDYTNIGSDINGEVKVAFDDSNFYVHAVINDDKFFPLAGDTAYWRGDGIQMTFTESQSQTSDIGCEVGVAWNPTTKNGEIYSVYHNAENIAKMTANMAVNEGQQVYDVIIPWEVLFDSGKPERFKFNICFNDNDDGKERHDCMEINDGILIGKSSEKCPELELMENGNDWYTWFDSGRSVNSGAELPGNIWIANEDTENKTFTVTSTECNLNKEIVIPPGTGVNVKYVFKGEKAGAYNYNISVKSGDRERKFTKDVNVSYPEADREYALQLIEDCKKWSAEINDLIAKVEAMGKNPQYEKVSAFVLEDFAYDRMPQDSSSIYYRQIYWRETLTEIYEDTKKDLEAIIAGEKEPVTAPTYKTSDLKIKGTMFYADTVWDGVEAERPVILTGYLLHYPLIQSGMEDMPKIGASSIETQITMADVIQNGNVTKAIQNNWPSGGVEGVAKKTDEAAYEGRFAYKMSATNDPASYRYRHIRTYCPDELKPETSYTYSFWAKAENVANYTWSIGNGPTHSISGTSDWTYYTETFKTAEGQTTIDFNHILYPKSTAIYLDNITLTEEGSDENLIPDGDFEFYSEEAEKNGYFVQKDMPRTLRQLLTTANEQNVSVELILATGHMTPQFLVDTFPEIKMQSSGFNVVNFNNPKYLEIAGKYVAQVMEWLKDYPCVNVIDLANEVQMNPYSDTKYYLPRFREYLLRKYGSLEKISEAHGVQYADIEEIKFPKSQTGKEPIAVEFDEYTDWELSEFHRYLTHIIHQYDPEMGVMTKIMDYTPDYGNIHMYAYQYNGTGLDSYSDVFNVNGCDAYNYLDWDKGRLIKNQWYDYMVGTNYAPVLNGEDHVLKDSSMNYDRRQADWVSNDMWQGAVHYRGHNAIWLWDSREAEVETKGSIKCRPDAIVANGETSLDLMRLSCEIEALQKEKRDVGILYSNASAVHELSYPGVQYYAYEAVSFSGKKVNYISENNISAIHDTKLLVIPACSYVKPETLTEIKKYIDNGGKVVIVNNNSLRKTEMFKDADKELVDYIYKNADVVHAEANRFNKGLTVGTVEEIYRVINDAIEKAGIDYVTLVDAETGEEVYNVEYISTVYDGKLLINIANWGEETKTLKVMVDGKEVTGFTELRKQVSIEGDIVAEYLRPILIAKEWDGTCFMDTIGSWAEESVNNLYKKGLINGVTETRYEPQRKITRAEYISLLMRANGADTRYRGQISDVPVDAWYADSVAAALSMGIIGKENFRPNDIITREEMADLAVKSLEAKLGAVSSEGKTFTDVSDAKYRESVEKAANLGIISGYEDGTFRPEEGLTRAEVAAVIERYVEKIN